MVIGEDELSKGEVVLKDMRDGTQTSIPASDVVQVLAQRMAEL